MSPHTTAFIAMINNKKLYFDANVVNNYYGVVSFFMQNVTVKYETKLLSIARFVIQDKSIDF